MNHPRVYPELEFLEQLEDFGIKLGLDKTFDLLKRLGNPHTRYPSVLIAGTNGKGSTAKTLASIVEEAGYRSGLYTSPHLVDVRERISVNGRSIPKEDFLRHIRNLKRIIEKLPYHLYPTYFEALTALSFAYFAEKKVDILIAEVGMGGRFDATNVLPASLEIITSVGFDHMQYLGSTLAEIAGEKAGIIKERSLVVSARQRAEVARVLREKVRAQAAAWSVYGTDFRGERRGQDTSGQTFDFLGEERLAGLRTPLLGRHQIENVCLAVQACNQLRKKGWNIPGPAVRAGLEKTNWPARFQVLQHRPALVLDGSHNPSGIKVLQKTIKEVFPNTSFSFLVGILKDKDWKTMLGALLADGPEEIVFTRPETERALEPELLAQYVASRTRSVSTRVIPRVRQAYQAVRTSRRNFCICGSLYLAGEILQCLK